MSENFGRVFGGMAALAVLWIIVYWWWEPRGGAITFDTGSHAALAPSGETPPLSAEHPTPDLDPAPAEGEAPPGAPVGTPAAGSPRPPTPAIIPPQFRLYTVKGGDTLARIAERELGSRAYVDAIIRSNPLTSPENLAKAGRQIKIPVDPANIRGTPNPEAAAPPRAEASRPPRADPAPPPASPPEDADAVEYTVREGDTLTEISRAHYGTIKHADLIAQANGIDADHLKIGQKLKLPPKPR
jgi:LysM repeat protein